MAFKTKKHLYSRKFLNSDRGIAAIQCEVELTNYGVDVSNGYVDAAITISDCHKTVHLDFSMYSKKDVARKLAKMELLIAEMVKFQTALKKAGAEYGKPLDKTETKKPVPKKLSKTIVVKSKL